MASRLEEEKQKPIKDAIALAQQRKTMASQLSESLKKPFQPSTGEDPAASPPTPSV